MITGFEGRMGQGKSLAAASLAYLEEVHYNKKVISNMSLNFPYTKFDHKYFLEHIEDQQLNNCVTLLDEAQQYLDSRRSSGKLNVLWSYYVVQTRKRDVDLYATFHNIDVMDKRFRRQMDNRSTCHYAKEAPCRLCGGTGDAEDKNVTCPNCSGDFTTFVVSTTFGAYGAVKKTKIPFPILRRFPETTPDCYLCKGTGLVCPRCLGYKENGTANIRMLSLTTGVRRGFTFWGPASFGLFDTTERISFTGKQLAIAPEDL